MSSEPNSLTDRKWRERLRSLTNLPTVFKMLWEAAPAMISASLFFRVIAALLPFGMLVVTKRIIDSIVNVSSHHTALPVWFWWLLGAEFAMASLAIVLARLIEYCENRLNERYITHVNTRIMRHASTLDLSSFEDPLFYDSLERARVQGADRVGMIQESGQMLQQVIGTATLAAGIFLISPWMLFALVACVIPGFLAETNFAFENYSLSVHQTPWRRELEYLRLLGTSKESAKEQKLFALGQFFVERYDTISHQIHKENITMGRRKLVIGTALSLIGTVGYYATYAFGIYEAVTGKLSLGTLTFLAGALLAVNTNIQGIFTIFSRLADHALFLGDLIQFFSVVPKIASRPDAIPGPRPIQAGFEFRDVCFSYPRKSRPVLENVNFRLEPGERIALVGANGQGKTTIVKLLTRLYDVTSGQILLDGVDIRDYKIEDLWKNIGVIFQDFMRYEMTASDNIAVGRIEERDNKFHIRAAAFKSLAESVVHKLPNGYSQMLGCRFAGGVDLSGGEWQRIALARTYLRDAQMLILDEPTAALDARAEHEVFQRFADLTKGKMSVFISHRFSTVRMADRILVLENGTIAEQGAHSQLLSSGGCYAEMFELQAAHYR